jgi:bifunctional non-homologous end joining protein LigD
MDAVLPMLASPAEEVAGLPTDGSRWAYEVKWDGMRVLADLHAGVLRLTSRLGNDVTIGFPELADLAGVHPDVLLDGEVVVLRGGVPSFAALAERMHVRDPRRARALAAKAPATFVVFDVLRLFGVDLCARPWEERRAALERLAPSGRAWQLSPVYDDGAALLAATRDQGLEGVVAKRRESRYTPGARSSDWIKFAHRHVQACLVGGWRPETNGSGRIGALLVGVWGRDGAGPPELRYRGRVGSGLSLLAERDLRRMLAPLAVDTSPFADDVPRADASGAHWTVPRVVVEVRHTGRTEGDRLRQPVFRGMRSDVAPQDVVDEP